MGPRAPSQTGLSTTPNLGVGRRQGSAERARTCNFGSSPRVRQTRSHRSLGWATRAAEQAELDRAAQLLDQAEQLSDAEVETKLIFTP